MPFLSFVHAFIPLVAVVIAVSFAGCGWLSESITPPRGSDSHEVGNPSSGLVVIDATLARDLGTQGEDLTPQEAGALEDRLEEDPGASLTRARLLGFYFAQGATQDLNQALSARKKRLDHVLWFIRNDPESSILATPWGAFGAWEDTDQYSAARRAWLDQVESNPENLLIVYNAAKSFSIADGNLAIELMKRAQAIDHENPELARELGHLYNLRRIGADELTKVRYAELALGEFERAYELGDGEMRDSATVELMIAAYESRRPETARHYAETALSDGSEGWNRENRIHYAHLTLGRLALAGGNVETARAHLLAAGSVKGSPQLDTFGSDMMLAKELLEVGERDVVLRYFDLCSEFWEMGIERLAEWKEQVESGTVHDLQFSM